MAWTDQRLPFHRSANVTLAPAPFLVSPTAMHARTDTHDTPERSPRPASASALEASDLPAPAASAGINAAATTAETIAPARTPCIAILLYTPLRPT